MKTKLKSAKYFYSEDNEYLGLLKALGFEFKMHKSHGLYLGKDEVDYELNDLNQLIELSRMFNCRIVFNEDELIIYNDYLE